SHAAPRIMDRQRTLTAAATSPARRSWCVSRASVMAQPGRSSSASEASIASGEDRWAGTTSAEEDAALEASLTATGPVLPLTVDEQGKKKRPGSRPRARAATRSEKKGRPLLGFRETSGTIYQARTEWSWKGEPTRRLPVGVAIRSFSCQIRGIS